MSNQTQTHSPAHNERRNSDGEEAERWGVRGWGGAGLEGLKIKKKKHRSRK